MALILTTDSYQNGEGFESPRGTLKSRTVKCYLSTFKLPDSNWFVGDCFH